MTSDANVAIPHIEADANEDTDSAFEGSLGSASYATTLASSVKNYVYANGRRYNSFRAGQYILPNDEDEQDRMDLTHHIYKLLLGGDIYISPIKPNPQRVLDIGTGTGIWAIDFADAHPESQVVGNDLSPIQPSWVPTNCVFEIDDLEAAWPYTRPFDFIHARELAGSIADFDKLFEQAYQNLVPGGYFEIQSIEPCFYSDDGTLAKANHAVDWVRLEFEASSKFGKPLEIVPLLPEKLKKAGFQDVTTQLKKLPLGTWPKDKKLKEVGRFQQLQVLQALEPYSLFLFTKILGWTVEETQVLLTGVRKDIKSRDIHMYSWVHFTRAQKPENPSAP
ncbi:TAM domain methyltransferase [Histoplasma capsulatum G186AR]|uniref:TAM domain methyltransferase n=1 Tax=Ajellomyces capsulatus TaxID=5037 RepID=A0A8H8CSR2_AJECA|nr:TAM domain methyltransferase [Histoplasma capsulatum]QSS70739.1 TAM domain methyltransferase [Histoplasma capsulatum G186AR]